nr:DUF6524 family protein [Roseovarius carneus]
MLLAAGYIIYLRASLRSISAFDIVMVMAIVGVVLWCVMIYVF